ncbi:MAG: flagellar M-ring protein FliF C-terminal domain-containing protein [Candidatus Eremiobacterota bacterium]
MSDKQKFFNPVTVIKNWPLSVKIGAGIILIMVITGGLLYNNYLFNRQLISIYNNTIEADEIDQMRNILSNSGYKEGVDFSVQTADKKSVILVRRDLAGMIQDQLAGEGLPSNEDKVPGTGFSSTQDQIEDARRIELEQRIARDVKNMEGIKKATVRIVPPRDSLFENEEGKQPAKASVYIEIKDGYKINSEKTQSIMALVANSFEGLEKKNVVVVDEDGKILSDAVIAGEDPNGTLPLDVRQARQYELQEKYTKNIQEFLDGILGKGNSKVLVNVVLNFDGTERMMTVYGNPGSNGETMSQAQDDTDSDGIITIGGRSIGQVNQDGSFRPCGDEVVPESNGVHVLSMERLREKYNKGNGETVSGNGAGYDKIEERFNYQLNSYQTKVVPATGRVEKISIALALNNVPEKYIADLKDVVGASVGIDEGRGDFISVINAPMHMDPVAKINVPSSYQVRTNTANLKAFVWSGAFIIMVCLLIYGLYLIKEKKSNNAKMKLCLTTGPSTGINSITDLVSDKGGRTVGHTTFQSFDRLTSMAKEKPNKVAELLKTSWMADKGA